ncbi:hypothetical protein BD779DRAFT_1539173 [Infundibulicybe gibba]|nr:hypothetical protein BD779DRAFT_1539173 [Infundibulicybe gibba]
MITTTEKRQRSKLKDAMRPRTHRKPQISSQYNTVVMTHIPGNRGLEKPTPCLHLPLQEWQLGLKDFHGEHGLFWSSDANTILIRKGPISEHSLPIITLHTQDIDLVEYHDPSQVDNYAISVLTIHTTYPSQPSQTPCQWEHARFFSPGKGMKGKITCQFNQNGFGWSPAKYGAFIEWLKSCIPQSNLAICSSSGTGWTVARPLIDSGIAKGAKLQFLGNKKSPTRFMPNGPGCREALPLTQTLPHEPNLLLRSSGLKRDSALEHRVLLFTIPHRGSNHQAEAGRKSPPKVNPNEIILTYPLAHRAPGAIKIKNADLDCLQPGQYLNDNLIEFGLKYALDQLESSDPGLAKRMYVFNTFFYTKLNKEGYKGVQRWTTGSSIFDKKYIIIPIHENEHWYLTIIYRPRAMLQRAGGVLNGPDFGSSMAPALIDVDADNTQINDIMAVDSGTGGDQAPKTYIFTLDSLGSKHSRAINQISQFLKKEAGTKLGQKDTENPRGMQAMVPTQPNFSDCGVYLLHLAETFMAEPAKYCKIMMVCPLLFPLN